MYNVLLKGSQEGGHDFQTELEMLKFFETHNKEDYIVLGQGIRMRHDDKVKYEYEQHMRNIADTYTVDKFDKVYDLQRRIDDGEAIRIASNEKYDYYAIYFGVFVSKHKDSGIVRNIKYFWKAESNDFYIKINYKRKRAAKLMWETFYGKLLPGEEIKFHDGNKANLDINNLYV